MAVLTAQKPNLSGAALTYAAASAGGDKAAAGINRFVHVKVGATATTVTIDSVQPCDQGADHNLTSGSITSTDRMIGPLDPRRFADANGDVNISYSQVTGVTIALIEVG